MANIMCKLLEQNSNLLSGGHWPWTKEYGQQSRKTAETKSTRDRGKKPTLKPQGVEAEGQEEEELNLKLKEENGKRTRNNTTKSSLRIKASSQTG